MVPFAWPSCPAGPQNDALGGRLLGADGEDEPLYRSFDRSQCLLWVECEWNRVKERKDFMSSRHASVAAMVAGLLIVFLSAGRAEADGGTPAVNLKGIKCPVCSMQAKPSQSVDYKGGKLYFGCAACPPRFQRNPSKYAAKANAQLVATKQARQKSCPIMGGKPNKELKMKVGGADVFFCCPRCRKPVEALKGDAQIEKVFNEKTFAKAFEIPEK